MRVALAIPLLLVVSLIACIPCILAPTAPSDEIHTEAEGKSISTSRGPDNRAWVEHVREVREKYEDYIWSLPNVTGTGVGLKRVDGVLHNEVVIRVYVSEIVEGAIPSQLDDVPVCVIVATFEAT